MCSIFLRCDRTQDVHLLMDMETPLLACAEGHHYILVNTSQRIHSCSFVKTNETQLQPLSPGAARGRLCPWKVWLRSAQLCQSKSSREGEGRDSGVRKGDPSFVQPHSSESRICERERVPGRRGHRSPSLPPPRCCWLERNIIISVLVGVSG